MRGWLLCAYDGQKASFNSIVGRSFTSSSLLLSSPHHRLPHPSYFTLVSDAHPHNQSINPQVPGDGRVQKACLHRLDRCPHVGFNR